jgi:hypothetical protein
MRAAPYHFRRDAAGSAGRAAAQVFSKKTLMTSVAPAHDA